MPQPAPTAFTPVDGLRGYVANWRKAVTDHQFAGAQETRSFRQTLALIRHPLQREETVASFFAVLDATDHYINEVLAPAYENDPKIRHHLDRYWQGRETVFREPAEKLPVTKNGMSVARMFIDCWLDHTGIGTQTPQYEAVVQASKAFQKHIYGAEIGARRR